MIYCDSVRILALLVGIHNSQTLVCLFFFLWCEGLSAAAVAVVLGDTSNIS